MAGSNFRPSLERRESPDSPLFRLPGELRNRIYEFVFENGSDTIDVAAGFFPTDDSDTTDTADQLRRATAAPPSTVLMRTCQKINEESKLIFAAAYTHYWEKQFTIEFKDMRHVARLTPSLPWRLIDSFIVSARITRTKVARAQLSRIGGIWKIEDITADLDCGQPGSDEKDVREDESMKQFYRSLLYLVLDWECEGILVNVRELDADS